MHSNAQHDGCPLGGSELGMHAFKRLNDNYRLNVSKLNDSLNEHGGDNEDVFNISFSTFIMSAH